MKHYIGNCQPNIDCEKLISDLQLQKVEPFHEFMTLPNNNPYFDDINNQIISLTKAGYNESTVEYTHYKSGTHFSKDIEIEFGKIVKANPLICWISEIKPGKCSPWHWDVNPWEHEHNQLGTVVRFFCFLSKPAPGHIFIVESDAYYYETQGAIYQYPDVRSYHAGTNIGLETKYLLTFTGVR